MRAQIIGKNIHHSRKPRVLVLELLVDEALLSHVSPGCLAAIFFCMVFFRVTQDERSEKGTSLSLFLSCKLLPGQSFLLFLLEFSAQLWTDDVLKPLGRDGEVIAVRVHLDQLEIAAIKIMVHGVIVVSPAFTASPADTKRSRSGRID